MVLKAYWPLDETSGSTAKDVRGGSDGTVNGATMGANGILGNTAYDFDGTDDYVNTNDGGGLAPKSSARTYCLWFKTSGVSSQSAFLGASDGESTKWYTLRLVSDGTVQASFDDASNDGFETVQSSSSFDDGEWHFTAVTRTNNYDYTLYVDGSKRDTAVGEGDVTTGRDTLVGAYNADVGTKDHFGGRIADVRVYDHALTQQEVQYLYQVSRRGRLVSGKRQS